MGTSAPPDTGYRDDQRVNNWDSPIIYSDNNRAVIVNFTVGPFNVSRYAYLGGIDITHQQDLQAIFTWYADQATTQVVGGRQFQLSQQFAHGAQYRLPNLGPWVTIEWANITGGTALHISQLFATNRFHPLEFIPLESVLINQAAVVLGPGQLAVVYPSDYYAGPVDVWMNATAAGLQQQLQYLKPDGTWGFALNIPTTTGASDTQSKYVTPPGAWRITLNNVSGANITYYLNVRQSQTGST